MSIRKVCLVFMLAIVMTTYAKDVAVKLIDATDHKLTITYMTLGSNDALKIKLDTQFKDVVAAGKVDVFVCYVATSSSDVKASTSGSDAFAINFKCPTSKTCKTIDAAEGLTITEYGGTVTQASAAANWGTSSTAWDATESAESLSSDGLKYSNTYAFAKDKDTAAKLPKLGTNKYWTCAYGDSVDAELKTTADDVVATPFTPVSKPVQVNVSTDDLKDDTGTTSGGTTTTTSAAAAAGTAAIAIASYLAM